jgi:hypothetical protein
MSSFGSHLTISREWNRCQPFTSSSGSPNLHCEHFQGLFNLTLWLALDEKPMAIDISRTQTGQGLPGFSLPFHLRCLEPTPIRMARFPVWHRSVQRRHSRVESHAQRHTFSRLSGRRPLPSLGGGAVSVHLDAELRVMALSFSGTEIHMAKGQRIDNY